jgi:hypothetical protein
MGGMRAPLPPERAKPAWTAQAQTAAIRLQLNDEETAKLTDAYIAAREHHQAAIEKLRDELRQKMEADDDTEGDPQAAFRAMRQAMDELRRTEREALVAALAEAISQEQTRKAAASLGTFSNSWDYMVDAIIGFKLDSGAAGKSLGASETFIIAMEQARAAGRDDPGAARTAMEEARDSFNDTVEPLLTEEQFEQLQASIFSGRGGGFGGPGGPGGPGGAGGGGAGGAGGGGRGGADAPPPPPPPPGGA